MKFILYICCFICTTTIAAQRDFGTPVNETLPEKLQKLPRAIIVHNFPKEIDPIKIGKKYYWKHNTMIFSKGSSVKIKEFGAYLYYNGKWNLRKSYPLKDLDNNFGTKKQLMLQAHPYTWNNNWRVGPQLFGGWAMWYFIGENDQGEMVCGYEKINTTNNVIKSKS